MTVKFVHNQNTHLIRTSGLPNDNAAYTWMAWVSVTTWPGSGASYTIFEIDNGSGGVPLGDYLQLTTNASVQSWDFSTTNGAWNDQYDGPYSTGTWYHLAVVRESLTSCKLYVNGVLKLTHTEDMTGRAAADALIVGDTYGSGNVSGIEGFEGTIAYIKMWSKALTITGVVTEMNTIRPIDYDSLWGWWPTWNGGATEFVKDYSGNTRDWTAGNTPIDDTVFVPVSWGQDVYLVPSHGISLTAAQSGSNIHLAWS